MVGLYTRARADTTKSGIWKYFRPDDDLRKSGTFFSPGAGIAEAQPSKFQ